MAHACRPILNLANKGSRKKDRKGSSGSGVGGMGLGFHSASSAPSHTAAPSAMPKQAQPAPLPGGSVQHMTVQGIAAHVPAGPCAPGDPPTPGPVPGAGQKRSRFHSGPHDALRPAAVGAPQGSSRTETPTGFVQSHRVGGNDEKPSIIMPKKVARHENGPTGPASWLQKRIQVRRQSYEGAFMPAISLYACPSG
jgi:hypothetical protein